MTEPLHHERVADARIDPNGVSVEDPDDTELPTPHAARNPSSSASRASGHAAATSIASKEKAIHVCSSGLYV